ncbi:MAG: S8 family serine peptidase, partial [Coriobacteriales bacterium]|nr:S8 family serine peptidase [Coriobacteriales bacterium]
MKHFRHILRTTLAFVLAASLLLFGVPSAFATPAAPSDPTQNSGTGTAGGGNGTGNGGGSGNGAGSGTGNGTGSGAGDFGDPSTYVPDQIIVIFEENAQLEADIEALKDDMDALAEEIQENSPELSPATTEAEDNETQVEIVTENDKDSLFAVVDLPDEVDVLTALELALENPSVIGVSPDYYIHPLDDEPLDLSQSIETLASVNDPFYSSQQYGLPLIRAPEAWDYAQCNGAVTVAVVDGGARLTHEDLAANLDLAHAWDGSGDSAAANKPLLQAVANGEIPYEGDTGVSSGHGTHVSGIVSAVSNNNKGIAGVSYNATVLPVNIYYNPGSGYTTTVQRLVRAYDYLIDLKSSGQTPNLRVINLSLGTPGWSEQSITSVRNKIIAAENLGMLTVAAAGNSASSVNIYPADIDKAVAVTSVDSNKQLLSTSSYGDEKDICAPGANIYSTWYDSNTGYGYNTGTSMAAPMVAGVAALMWAANPNLTVDQVKNILFSTAEDLGAPGKDPYYGHGLVDAAAALESICPPHISGDDVITLTTGYSATTRTYVIKNSTATPTLNNNTANASINTGGVLTIPAGLAVGTYSTTINATNSNGTTTKTVTVKVNPVPPAIEGGLSSITLTEGYANYSSAYTITGVPTPALSLTNNTAGATLAANGFIIPAGLTPGSYTVTLSASNVGGTATKTV